MQHRNWIVGGAVLFGAALSGCGGGTHELVPPPPTTAPHVPRSVDVPPPTLAPSAYKPTSTTTATTGGAVGGTQAVAILPAPSPAPGPNADPGSLSRSKIAGADLHLLGIIPTAAPYSIGPVNSQGEVDSASWPDACQLLSAVDFKTLIPSSSGLKTQGQHGAFLGGGETAHYASCKYDFSIPGDDTVDGQPSWVQIDINDVGDPAGELQQWTQSFQQQQQAAAQYPDQFMDYSEGQMGPGVKCFYDGNQLNCVKGHFNFDVLGQDTTIISSGGSAVYAQDHGWVQQVEANVVKTIAARMS